MTEPGTIVASGHGHGVLAEGYVALPEDLAAAPEAFDTRRDGWHDWLSLQGLDFVFLIAALCGVITLQCLSLIDEPGGSESYLTAAIFRQILVRIERLA